MASLRGILRTALLLLAVAGCQTVEAPNSLPATPSAQITAGIRHLTVVVTPPSAPPHMVEPPSGVLEGAGAGALAGLGVGLAFMGSATGDLSKTKSSGDTESIIIALWLVLAAVVVSVCVVGGTLYGSLASMPADELEQRLAVVAAAWQTAGPDIGISAAMQEAVNSHWPNVLVDGETPGDARLDVRIRTYGLTANFGFDPDTKVVVIADVELDVPGTWPPYRARFEYEGPMRKFTEWTCDQTVVVSELRLAASQLAQHVADQVLLVERESAR